jgi:hypothetical protein
MERYIICDQTHEEENAHNLVEQVTDQWPEVEHVTAHTVMRLKQGLIHGQNGRRCTEYRSTNYAPRRLAPSYLSHRPEG